MMYRLRFYENGRFCTELGGPLLTLPVAVAQMNKLTAFLVAEEMPDIIGLKWMRSGETPCAIVVVDDFGQFIENIKIEE